MATDSSMSTQASAISGLSPEQKRALLAELLRKKAAAANTFPMSEGQQGLWHAFRRDPEATSFNVFLPTRVRSGLDLQALQQALNLVTARNPLLTATFSDAEGKLLQTIHPNQQPEFSVLDLQGQTEEQVLSEISQETLRPFDLEQGPLLRILVYQIGPGDFVVLALTHHIVVDFWSLVLILDELRQAYAAFAQNRRPQLEPAVANYADFVRQQQQLLNSPQGEAMRDFWRGILRGGSTVVELPTDFVRPANFSGRAANCPLALSDHLVPMIKESASRNQATPFAVLQAAVQVFVARYSGESQFFIGSPFSGRSQRQFERTVGFFVNMLPLQADLSKAANFDQLIQNTARDLFHALENEAYPISRMVPDAGIVRDSSRSPIFQVSCTFEKAQLKNEAGRASFLFPGDAQVWDFGGIRQESYFVPVQTCHYDLEFIFEQTDTSLRGMLCYCQDLFAPEAIHLFAENFASLLENLLCNAQTPLADVPWTRPGSRALPKESTAAPVRVDTLLLQAAHRSPNRSAIVYEGETISYAQLLHASQAIRTSLGLDDLPMQSTVPILAERGPDIWAAMLAVHQSGHAFIPLEPSQLGTQLSELQEQAQAPFILAHTDCFPTNNVPCKPFHLRMVSDRAPKPPSASSAEDLAYVVFTSGSTGVPKGVMIEHRAVSNTLQWRSKDVPLAPSDRVLLLLSHQFDASLAIAWSVLAQGATLVIADPETLRDPDRIVDLMTRERINVLPAPPSLLSLIVAQPRFQECAKQLKYVWTGGEAMTPDFPAKIRQQTSAKFFNFYGPTEAAIEATFCEVQKHDAQRPVPLGKAIRNTEILIVDANQKILPDTVPGEIAIGGAGLARGYLNDPELTARRFVAHPNDPTGTQKIYLTGDRGRINALGEVEFYGRLDHQVKLRGYRIELGELESAIESHPWIDRAGVIVLHEGTAQAKLIAYASATPIADKVPAESVKSQVRQELSNRLPKYKLPAALVLLDEMPLTSSGKVDRKRLPRVESSELGEAIAIAPETELEQLICDAWKASLDLPEVGTNQNFFDLGGSSLQAALLTSKLSEEFGVQIPTSLLFDLADISQMACRLAQLHPDLIRTRFGERCLTTHLQTSEGSLATLHSLLAPLGNPQGKQPLFMVHPPGGIVVCYRELANHLTGQGIFAVRSHGLHGKEELPATIEAMASSYIEAIRSVQSTGPYLLGGWSLGGLVAYEAAQQLIQSGERVDRLILLDTTIPQGASDLVPESEQVNVGREYGIELTLEQLGELAPEDQLPFLWEHAKKLGVVDDNSPAEVVAKALEELQELFHHHVSVCRDYHLQPIDARILLFRPTEIPCELQVSEDRGWRHLSRQGVDVRFVPGHHHSMVQSPNVEVLAEKLTSVLRSA